MCRMTKPRVFVTFAGESCDDAVRILDLYGLLKQKKKREREIITTVLLKKFVYTMFFFFLYINCVV